MPHITLASSESNFCRPPLTPSPRLWGEGEPNLTNSGAFRHQWDGARRSVTASDYRNYGENRQLIFPAGIVFHPNDN